jgi:hypothetical protein
MQVSTEPRSVVVAREDLHVLAELASMRLPLRAPESRRLERMRTLLVASSELCRALSAHTHCALVNCQGSHGTGSLQEEGEALFQALSRYGTLLHEMVSDYQHLTEETPAPVLTLESAGPRREVA